MPVFPGTPSQEGNARILVGVGKTLKAPQLALEAIMCIGWGENSLAADGCNSSNHCGLFQLSSTLQAEHDYHDIAYWAGRAYQSGFWSYGGIIPMAIHDAGLSPGDIANRCQGAYQDLAQGAAYYNQYLTLVRESLLAVGDTAPMPATGGGGSSTQSQWSLQTQRMIDTIDADDWSPWLNWGAAQMHLRSRQGYLFSGRAALNCESMSLFNIGGGR